jgi:hypothetical protein
MTTFLRILRQLSPAIRSHILAAELTSLPKVPAVGSFLQSDAPRVAFHCKAWRFMAWGG